MIFSYYATSTRSIDDAMPGILVEINVVTINVKLNSFFYAILDRWYGFNSFVKNSQLCKTKNIKKKFVRKHSELLQDTWLILFHVKKVSLANFLISHNMAIVHFI